MIIPSFPRSSWVSSPIVTCWCKWFSPGSNIHSWLWVINIMILTQIALLLVQSIRYRTSFWVFRDFIVFLFLMEASVGSHQYFLVLLSNHVSLLLWWLFWMLWTCWSCMGTTSVFVQFFPYFFTLSDTRSAQLQALHKMLRLYVIPILTVFSSNVY